MAKRRANNEGTITKRKDGRWQVRITVGYDPITGKPIRKYFYAKKQKEAEAILTEMKQKLRTGTYVEPSKIRFGEWILKWLDVYVKPNVKPETYTDYYDCVTKHINPGLGHYELQDLNNIIIQEYYNQKRVSGRLDGTGGVSARRIHMMHQLINGSLKKAVKLHMIPINPAEDIELPPLKYKEFETLSADEVKRYLDAAREDRLYAAFLLELTTGLRRSELLGIPRDCFDPVKGEIRIVQTLKRKKLAGEEKSRLIISEPKTQKSKRTIPLLPEVVAEIKRFQAIQRQERLFYGPKYKDSGLLFTSQIGTPLEPRGFNRRHERILKKAGLKHVRVHDLRHTFATLLLQNGESPSNVSEILGHARTSTTLDIYGHSTSEGKVRAVSRMGKLINIS